MNTVKSLGEYHPRNLAASLFSDDTASEKTKTVSKTDKPEFDPDAT